MFVPRTIETRRNDNVSSDHRIYYNRRFFCSQFVAHVLNHAERCERAKLAPNEERANKIKNDPQITHFPEEPSAKINPARLHYRMEQSDKWRLIGGWQANSATPKFVDKFGKTIKAKQLVRIHLPKVEDPVITHFRVVNQEPTVVRLHRQETNDGIAAHYRVTDPEPAVVRVHRQREG